MPGTCLDAIWLDGPRGALALSSHRADRRSIGQDGMMSRQHAGAVRPLPVDDSRQADEGPSRTLALTLLLFPATFALSADAVNFAAITTRDLVRPCSSPESNEYCLGFVDAATDYDAVIISGDLLEPVVFPGRTSGGGR